MARVFVAMSGGVDSSVAAALLCEQGHDVTGVTMRLLDEDAPGGCCPSGSVRDAKRVCDILGVPHYTLDLRDAFECSVVGPTCEAYASGRTPNPCVWCNESVKFVELMRRALAQDADLLATGHYARVVTDDAGARRLGRGLDPGKDQSYFMYRLTAEQMTRVAFPVGELPKERVREIAREHGLPVADRPESQEVCFAPDGIARFVGSRVPAAVVEGVVLDEEGRAIGRHAGVATVTVGQRRGLRTGGSERRFVTSVDAAANTVTARAREALLVRAVVAEDVVWQDCAGPKRVTARMRYRAPETAATAEIVGHRLIVRFDAPVEVSAPGQAVVCWAGDTVMGGGTLVEAT